MAPAVYISPASSDLRTQEKPALVAAVPAKGTALAIGSPATAQDGKYQSLITSLEESRQVERHMVDRLLDGGAHITVIRGSGIVSTMLSHHPPRLYLFFRPCHPLSVGVRSSCSEDP